MSTFIGQLIGFAAIVWLVVRYVVPPVRNLMAARQKAVRQQEARPVSTALRIIYSFGHTCAPFLSSRISFSQRRQKASWLYSPKPEGKNFPGPFQVASASTRFCA